MNIFKLCGDEYMNNEVLLSRIRELCKKNNITIANLEKRMRMGTGTISRWNKANPSFDKIVSIAQYFKVSIDYLAGYDVDYDASMNLDEDTLKIIDYLLEMTTQVEGDESFWHDYKADKHVEFLASDLPSMSKDNEDMSKLLYARDEIGSYLLEVVYLLNEFYDYKTQIRLYLVSDESLIPILECGNKDALQSLWIAAIKRLEMLEVQQDAMERVKIQRDKIIKKYDSQNE